MGVSTFSAAVHITPTVVKTLFKHASRKSSKFAKGTTEEDVTDDILYDEAFNIVKSFIELGTLNTVESLQKFTNTHIISPPWASVSPVLIPMSSCNDAADHLIEWFSPDELKRVVGGERWWQVRGLDGVDGEWVADKKMLSYEKSVEERIEAISAGGRKLSSDEVDILRMEPLQKVLLYIHGGAYFWGSINTHRYQIIKYARKIKGKAFAVNYRKAPQYPWPCPLQDILASYLYLIRPPDSALHNPIPSSKIVLAGDSAGGGLALSLLVLLRDLGLPMPAGAVLISPWVDLTHSFPSVMNNIKTDIIPPHGFIHKPSVVWPIDPSNEHGRVKETKTMPPPKPGHADTLKSVSSRTEKEQRREDLGGSRILSQEEMLKGHDSLDEKQNGQLDDDQGQTTDDRSPESDKPSPSNNELHLDDEEKDDFQPKPPKVLMEDPSATPLELRSQIQLYATNEQLTHPLVSPLLNGSLGNLPPLYIIAGDHEALRDEIMYLAHRAAYPEKFPPREDAIRESRRQQENVEKFKTPTKVHLQVFDGMCHVLTVFTFHNAVKYAYRSIAEFVKHVIDTPAQEDKTPVFPELIVNEPEERVLGEGSQALNENDSEQSGGSGFLNPKVVALPLKSITPDVSFSLHAGSQSTEELFEKNKAATKEQVQENVHANKIDSRQKSNTQDSDDSGSVLEFDFSSVVFVRQRVDIHGNVRQMEAIEDVPCLQLHPNEIGLLREAPARRWHEGQQLWDQKFKSVAKRVRNRRKKHEEDYLKMLERAKDLGLRHVESGRSTGTNGSASSTGVGIIQTERRWGPLDLSDENPPPSAIAARRDTPDALALLRKTLYHTAPRTIRRLPKRKAKDVVKATFDPADDPKAPPKQSASEQQHGAELSPVHGLKIWAYLMGYFGERSSNQAKKGTKKAASGAKKVGGKFRFGALRSKRTSSTTNAEGRKA